MRKLISLASLLLIVSFSYGQFGGGSGTDIDPYQIYSKSHLEELNDSLLSGNDLTDIHFNLMNDIIDSLRIPIGKLDYPFNGHFNGKGHNIVLAIDLRESTQYSYMDYCLFPKLYTNSSLDSISISGYIFASLGIVGYNYGNINYCINNLSSVFTHNQIITEIFETYGTIYSAGISCWNSGGTIRNCINNSELYGTLIGGIFVYCGMQEYQDAHVINCVNNGDIIIENTVLTESPPTCGGIGCSTSGFEINNMLIIENCINTGNVLFTGNQPIWEVGGILGTASMTHIINCQNKGNVSGKISNLGGIVGVLDQGEVINCSNYGNLSGESYVAGISAFGSDYILKNCFNSGMLQSGLSCGGIINELNSVQNTLMFNLNIANINESAIISNANDITINPLIISNNYYDKQMCRSKGIDDADVPNSAEGKLTTQLTGTNPELQEMLGTGWSYAEGRYPIPLGLENDSMALVAATPVYLHFETEEDYNHVDSVSRNFTVGLENNVSWDESNGRVSFSDENVTLLNLGVENLTVSLGDYSKNVRINIVDIETSAPIQTIENGISVYPNPARDFITLSLNEIKADKLEIYDIAGKLLSTNNINSELTKVFTGNLKSGIYLLKLYNKNQNITTLRFVKN